MTKPLRPTPTPDAHPDGQLKTWIYLSPTPFQVRAGVDVPPDKVIPIIFVPGIMGSNLKTDPTKTKKKSEQAWRPPNGTIAGIGEVKKWEKRGPIKRQDLLNPDTTLVDEGGPVKDCDTMAEAALFRKRGWGSVHADSYGDFLYRLQKDLNQTFLYRPANRAEKVLHPHWESVIKADRKKWGAVNLEPLTDKELKKFAEYHYPVYAVGYNWLRCCSEAADLLARKIDAWVAEWRAAHHQCDKVILVSHSLGGLVCRAYAKKHPGKVLGVIHGVQPATGAPLCYRRIVCGTEQSAAGNPDGGKLQDVAFATMLGRTPAETHAVMAVSPGPLELLPCHLYPKGWLKALVKTHKDPAPKEKFSLPIADPYAEIYREITAWYRLIDPALIDPGDKYKREDAGAIGKFKNALRKSEHFHKQVIGSYYHPNTYAFYGKDPGRLSFGTVRWLGEWDGPGELNPAVLKSAKPLSSNLRGKVFVDVGNSKPKESAQATSSSALWAVSPVAALGYQAGQAIADGLSEDGGDGKKQNPRGGTGFSVLHQDVAGDGTVPWQSGIAPNGQAGVKQLIRSSGYGHQDGFKDTDMRLLTFHLICKIAQEAA